MAGGLTSPAGGEPRFAPGRAREPGPVRAPGRRRPRLGELYP